MRRIQKRDRTSYLLTLKIISAGVPTYEIAVTLFRVYFANLCHLKNKTGSSINEKNVPDQQKNFPGKRL